MALMRQALTGVFFCHFYVAEYMPYAEILLFTAILRKMGT